jgi:hypothetical protein
LPSSKFRIVPRICFCVNVFSDLLFSNGHGADHTENTSCNTFSIVTCVLPRNRSKCHSTNANFFILTGVAHMKN